MKTLFRCFLLGLLSPILLVGQDVVNDADVAVEAAMPEIAAEPVIIVDEKTIPEAYAEVRYQGTWAINPFLKKTTTLATPIVDWSADWALAGMYKSTVGKITISLQNKQTGEFKRVTSDGDANSEFKLVSANFNRNRNEASVDLEKGGKKATVRYDENLTSRPVTVNNTFKAPGAGAPGNPNLRPGQPGQPGQMGQPVNVVPPAGQRGAVQPGVPPMLSPQVNGMVPQGQNSPVSPPTISRRRQLIPAPVVAPPAVQQ